MSFDNRDLVELVAFDERESTPAAKANRDLLTFEQADQELAKVLGYRTPDYHSYSNARGLGTKRSAVLQELRNRCDNREITPPQLAKAREAIREEAEDEYYEEYPSRPKAKGHWARVVNQYIGLRDKIIRQGGLTKQVAQQLIYETSPDANKARRRRKQQRKALRKQVKIIRRQERQALHPFKDDPKRGIYRANPDFNPNTPYLTRSRARKGGTLSLPNRDTVVEGILDHPDDIVQIEDDEALGTTDDEVGERTGEGHQIKGTDNMVERPDGTDALRLDGERDWSKANLKQMTFYDQAEKKRQKRKPGKSEPLAFKNKFDRLLEIEEI